MTQTNRERQAAFYARGRVIPRALKQYKQALASSYKLGRADALAGKLCRSLEDIPLPEVTHGRY